MDKARFVDRILETENLTDNLEDDDANILLDWGIGCLDTLIRDVEDEEVAGTRVMALMNVMRGINRIVGNFPLPNPAGLEDLLKYHESAFGAPPTAAVVDFQGIAAQVTKLTPAEAVQFLLDWVHPSDPTALADQKGD